MHRNRKHGYNRNNEEIVEVAVDDIFVSEKNIQRVLRDKSQIEKMRRDFESGRHMVRVVLHPRAQGGYDVEDGRHRVIAAKAAGVEYIDAVIKGR
ncbi:MAG: ParB/RepB/Spo0J family partition protein [Candidatus Obscuribacterales bacterium]|nr:ParB/RepB/Spo0J family partition protein [Candidatus Obscuribacterales bacterium]